MVPSATVTESSTKDQAVISIQTGTLAGREVQHHPPCCNRNRSQAWCSLICITLVAIAFFTVGLAMGIKAKDWSGGGAFMGLGIFLLGSGYLFLPYRDDLC